MSRWLSSGARLTGTNLMRAAVCVYRAEDLSSCAHYLGPVRNALERRRASIFHRLTT